jgi:hypothetical protein
MVAPLVDENLLSRCNIYCGACYIYRAQRDGGEFLDHVAGWQAVSKEEIRRPVCGRPASWYEESCHHCGGKLKD